MGKASQAKKAGRAFEELIAHIEAGVLPSSATMRSPDLVMDKTSKTLREVDASIRYTLGSVPILVTIECRDRSRKAEVTWIEQIIAKKNDIGANSTIGVSKKGFSKAAHLKAEQHGILLRETKELTQADILGGGILPALRHLSVTLKSCQIVFQEAKADCEPTVFALDGSSFETDKPFIQDRSAGRELTFDQLVHLVLDKHPDQWPADAGNDMEGNMFFELDPDNWFVRCKDSLSAVVGINLLFHGGTTVRPLQLAKAFDYVSESSQRLAQFQNWSGKAVNRCGTGIDVGLEIIFR